MENIKYCPGTLAEGFNTYSPGCLRNLFDGKKVSHVLPYEPPEQLNIPCIMPKTFLPNLPDRTCLMRTGL
jgi:hypothetical protein